MNLIEKLGLEKCKQIVDGAPVDAKTYSLILHMYSHLEIVTPFNWIFLSDFRTAIANHECDHDWENISTVESVERQLICTYCSERKTEPFDVNVKQWSDEETDHCTDIRNHISPNTKVIEQ
ncbi:hypothetical protein [Acinetobacter johnsonii]|uniref:hypothetical protein n=1 Tax=Acinetobacter johnsonii TaxID=40214 RepID=UPI001D0F28DF|nr:hypothetical protein [Acinetobacter johnsonii]